MNKQTKVNLIASCIVVIYFIGFVVLTFSDTCVDCVNALWTLFLIPTLTLNLLGYDGQSGAIIWIMILAEMTLFFFIIKWIISFFVKEKVGPGTD